MIHDISSSDNRILATGKVEGPRQSLFREPKPKNMNIRCESATQFKEAPLKHATSPAGNYTVYCLSVMEPGKEVVEVYKRYRDLAKLDQDLRTAFPEESDKWPDFPPKEAIAAFMGRKSLAERRQNLLHVYFQDLLIVSPLVAKHEVLLDFLKTSEEDADAEL